MVRATAPESAPTQTATTDDGGLYEIQRPTGGPIRRGGEQSQLRDVPVRPGRDQPDSRYADRDSRRSDGRERSILAGPRRRHQRTGRGRIRRSGTQCASRGDAISIRPEPAASRRRRTRTRRPTTSATTGSSDCLQATILSPPPPVPGPVGGGDDDAPGYAVTYAPGAAHSAEAQRIQLQPASPIDRPQRRAGARSRPRKSAAPPSAVRERRWPARTLG